MLVQTFSCNMAVREGLIRKLTLRAAGLPSKMSLRCEPFCRTLSRILTPPRLGDMQKKSLNVSSDFFFKYGGEGGVRTLDTLTRIHTFQACSFSHSDTSPFCHRQRFTLSTGANVGESDPSVNSLVP
jgi:hypothetical protein